MSISNTKSIVSILLHQAVPCGNAFIIDTKGVLTGLSLEFLAAFNISTRFVCFVCCEKQKDHAIEHIKEVERICNEMIEGNLSAYIHTQKENNLDIHLSKRILH